MHNHYIRSDYLSILNTPQRWLLAIYVSVYLAGCGDFGGGPKPGDEFLGEWVAEKTGAQFRMQKEGNFFRFFLESDPEGTEMYFSLERAEKLRYVKIEAVSLTYHPESDSMTLTGPLILAHYVRN